MLRNFMLILIGAILIYSCGHRQTTSPTSQTNQPNKSQVFLVGEGCDGCELIYAGIPSNINSVDTSSAWQEEGKKMLVQGTVYKLDGKSSASGIIIYYHHTDNKGFYSPSANQDEKSKRHGHIRGWVKTDRNGNYKIYTIKPAPYPGGTLPAHVHLTIKEPNINEYYIDEINFDDDTILTEEMRRHRENRGGSGIVKLSKNPDGLLVCTRNIILGKNIPNYK
jgi:protocatechuate 3,4-dioxygenase beta subunit